MMAYARQLSAQRLRWGASCFRVERLQVLGQRVFHAAFALQDLATRTLQGRWTPLSVTMHLHLYTFSYVLGTRVFTLGIFSKNGSKLVIPKPPLVP